MPKTKIRIPILLIRFSPINFSKSGLFSLKDSNHDLLGGMGFKGLVTGKGFGTEIGLETVSATIVFGGAVIGFCSIGLTISGATFGVGFTSSLGLVPRFSSDDISFFS